MYIIYIYILFADGERLHKPDTKLERVHRYYIAVRCYIYDIYERNS